MICAPLLAGHCLASGDCPGGLTEKLKRVLTEEFHDDSAGSIGERHIKVDYQTKTDRRNLVTNVEGEKLILSFSENSGPVTEISGGFQPEIERRMNFSGQVEALSPR